MDEELVTLLTTAHRLLGILEGMSMYMKDSEAIKDLMLLKECCYSRLIDKKDSPTFYNIMKNLSSKQDDMTCITHLVDAYKYSYGKPVENTELTKIYNIIIGLEAKEQIAVRNKQTFLNNAVTNLKIYSPAAPEHILPALQDIVKFLKRNDNLDVLIKAALAHYQFEMIHPYESCNGLVGRILIQMILFNAQHRATPCLCLSEYLCRNKDEYFDKLRTTQMGGGYIYWIKFFIRAVCSAASNAVEQTKRFVEIVAKDEKEIFSSNPSTKSVTLVYNYFKKNLVSEIKPAAKALELSFNTVACSVDKLSEMGVLKMEGMQSRHRSFLYSKALDAIT